MSEVREALAKIRKEFESKYRDNMDFAQQQPDRPATFPEMSCLTRALLELLADMKGQIDELTKKKTATEALFKELLEESKKGKK